MSRACERDTCEVLHVCSKCKVAQACTEYYRRKSITSSGRNRRGERITMCRTCGSRARMQWKRDNAERTRAYTRWWKYGLSQEGFDQLLSRQGGKCALCPAVEAGGKGTWHIDHDHSCCPGDHSCGECIRGLLCSNCNSGLGHFKDDPKVLRKAAAYVEQQL